MYLCISWFLKKYIEILIYYLVKVMNKNNVINLQFYSLLLCT